MGELAKARRALQDAKLLKERGFAIKDAGIQLLQERVWEASGLKQIWVCKKCPNFRLEMLVPARAIDCGQGHEASLLWEIPKEPLRFLFGSAPIQQQSHPTPTSQENIQPLQDSPGKSLLQPLPPLLSQRKKDD